MDNSKKSAGIIYSVKNKITGELYIGATVDSIENRKKDHEQKANSGHGHRFQEAISTYGTEAFSWKEIDTAESIDELAQKEKQYVLKYNSKEEGYNSDEGGGIQKTVYQYSIKDGSLLNTFDCLESAAKSVKANKTCIGNVCIGQNKTCKGFYWSYNLNVPFNPLKDLRKKKVIQYSLSGEQITIYESVSEASKVTGVSKTCIARMCRKERSCSGGFKWAYYR